MEEREIQETVSAAQKFFRANAREFLLTMSDAGGAKYPERFDGESNVIEAIRDIALIIDNEYADMSIGGAKFSSPQQLMDSLDWLRQLAAEHYSKVDAIKTELGFATDTIDSALDMCKRTRDSITYALSLYKPQTPRPESPHEKVITLIEGLSSVHRQLQHRHAARETLTISDEYDVQDLLHALLKIEFEDIRPEESCPSLAGLTHRVDLLLFKEKIMIEVKHTRANNAQKEIAHQLLVDIAAYKTHPRVDKLICVIWDGGHFLKNPNALKTDIATSSDEFATVLVLH